MRKLSPLAVVTAASLSLQLIAQAPLPGPVARIAPVGLDPFVNTTIINNDGLGNPITKIEQCELRSIGGGLYRVATTVHNVPATPGTVSLLTGTLNMTVNPPVWTPNQDVAAFNQVGTGVDEYQLSISSDGLNAVWDRYVATTYPNSGPAANSFCCHRNNIGVPFNINDIRAISGVGAGGVDTHIGEELPNGHVILYHIDFLVTNNAIVKGDLDPLTGTLTGVTLVAPYAPATTGFNHSPFVHRDSTGKARALNYSEYPATGPQNSSAYYTEGVNNDGTPEKIIDGASPVATWYNNPGLVGGSWHYTTSGQTEPQLQEVTMIANTTLTGGQVRIPAWSPARPAGGGVFISVIAIGTNVGRVSALPYPVPPVVNDIYLFPTVGITDIRFHDPFTGLAEWAFAAPALATQYDMQLITLNGASNSIIASNTAYLNL